MGRKYTYTIHNDNELLDVCEIEEKIAECLSKLSEKHRIHIYVKPTITTHEILKDEQITITRLFSDRYIVSIISDKKQKDLSILIEVI